MGFTVGDIPIRIFFREPVKQGLATFGIGFI